MRPRSFIVTVLALFVIANVIVAAMKRCGLGLGVAGGDSPLAAAAANPAAPAVGGPVGIAGLTMQLSRPLMCDVGPLGGLAASDRWLYVAAWDGATGAAVVTKIDPGAYAPAQTQSLDAEGAIAVGGIDVGAALVWVPVTVIVFDSGPRTVIFGLDAETLEVVHRFIAPTNVVALAEGPDGRVYGVDHDSAHWTVWRPDGSLSREAAGTGGVQYTDLDVVRGSLVAVGSDGATGVVDVIDPAGLTLLARYHVEAAAAAGEDAWVTSGGIAVRNEAILLLPQGGARPALLTYVPRSGGLEAFVPNVSDVVAPAQP